MNYTLLAFDELESTSDLLKEHFSSFSHFTIVKTNYQNKGRGQREKLWASNKDENILFSILLKDLDILQMDNLKQWTIESIINFLKTYNLDAEFREPNDIYIGADKISGILIESRSTKSHLNYVVIGVGININQLDFEGFKATSMKKLLKKTFDIEEMFENLLKILLNKYNEFILPTELA